VVRDRFVSSKIDREVTCSSLVVEEEILDYLTFVAEAEHELVVPEMSEVAHQVPENRELTDGDHGLGDIGRNVSDPRAETATQDHRLHVSHYRPPPFTFDAALSRYQRVGLIRVAGTW
jgi:hypothetical protein